MPFSVEVTCNILVTKVTPNSKCYMKAVARTYLIGFVSRELLGRQWKLPGPILFTDSDYYIRKYYKPRIFVITHPLDLEKK